MHTVHLSGGPVSEIATVMPVNGAPNNIPKGEAFDVHFEKSGDSQIPIGTGDPEVENLMGAIADLEAVGEETGAIVTDSLETTPDDRSTEIGGDRRDMPTTENLDSLALQPDETDRGLRQDTLLTGGTVTRDRVRLAAHASVAAPDRHGPLQEVTLAGWSAQAQKPAIVGPTVDIPAANAASGANTRWKVNQLGQAETTATSLRPSAAALSEVQTSGATTAETPKDGVLHVAQMRPSEKSAPDAAIAREVNTTFGSSLSARAASLAPEPKNVRQVPGLMEASHPHLAQMRQSDKPAPDAAFPREVNTTIGSSWAARAASLVPEPQNGRQVPGLPKAGQLGGHPLGVDKAQDLAPVRLPKSDHSLESLHTPKAATDGTQRAPEVDGRRVLVTGDAGRPNQRSESLVHKMMPDVSAAGKVGKAVAEPSALAGPGFVGPQPEEQGLPRIERAHYRDRSLLNATPVLPATHVSRHNADAFKGVQNQIATTAQVQLVPDASSGLAALATEPVPSEHFVTPLSDPALQTGVLRAAETMLARPEAARMVASQMAEAVMQTQNNRIEIALRPEELGRVRMVLSTSETGVTVSIVAERAETLDLMRRHIDQLAEEFRALGYQDIGFEFGNQDAKGGSQDGQSDDDVDLPVLSDGPRRDADPAPIQTARASQSRGLDLRL